MTQAVASPATGASAPLKTDERFYFPELDGLRFVAFLLVYLFHGGIPEGMLNQVVGRTAATALRQNGWLGVSLFFVLSGYLIGTLLLREEARYGRIDLRAFWIRRALRIWPLYYLTIALVFFLLPWVDAAAFGGSRPRGPLMEHLPYFLGFLGNWSFILLGPVPYDTVSILWSVCVEEQFYFVAPLVVAWLSHRWRIGVVVGVMAAAVVVRWVVALRTQNPLWIRFNTLAQLDTLFSGILLALLLESTSRRQAIAHALKWLRWPIYGGIVWVISRPNLATGTIAHRVGDLVAIWFFGAALVAVLVTREGWIDRALAYRNVVRLGRISYGLYMYHEIALWLRERELEVTRWFPNKEILLTIACFATTVALAALSYYGFERPFLKLKDRWTKVPSRPV